MSEINLNIIDEQHVRHGEIHGSVADAAVAALSAEPETIPELEAALTRFIKPFGPTSPFASFRTSKEIDETPWDAGIVIIDLAARLVAVETSYSMPTPSGEVHYHNGKESTDVAVMYRVPEDWNFVDSVAEYNALREKRRMERAAYPPLDTRHVLYGRPLLEWIANAVHEATGIWSAPTGRRLFGIDGEVRSPELTTLFSDTDNPEIAAIQKRISDIHGRWLRTSRDDLRGQSPREVLFAKRDFIDFDLNSRELQWSFLDEGPPCLSLDSHAYRYAGVGTHEWVIYYDLVRHLLWNALSSQRVHIETVSEPNPSRDIESAIAQLEEIKTTWLEQPQRDYDGRTPAILIENERKRLPIAMSPRDMIVDENCPTCQMFADETALGLGVGFWHLDGCNMDDDFVFSYHRTREEWEAERLEWREFSDKFNREWEEKQQMIARGETTGAEPRIYGYDRFDSDTADSESNDDDNQGNRRSWGPRGWGAA